MYSELQKTLSAPRLESFRQTDFEDIDTVTYCLWNTALCESFYPVLQLLEVGLRNRIHSAMTFCQKTPRWFDGYIMCDRCKEDAKAAAEEVAKQGHDPSDDNRIIAELSFGFWARLFNKHYQRELWNNKTFLLRALPYATNVQRDRSSLATRVDRMRRFRNKIFHHERILGLPIQQQYDEIVELLGWLDPTLVNAVQVVCRFSVVTKRDYADQIKESLVPHFAAKEQEATATHI